MLFHYLIMYIMLIFICTGDMHALGEFYKKNCIEDFQYIEQFKQMKHPLTGEVSML